MKECERALREMAEEYGLESVMERLDAIKRDTASRLVFLGEFSSGKTSLINKIVSMKLPVGTKPTTKAI